MTPGWEKISQTRHKKSLTIKEKLNKLGSNKTKTSIHLKPPYIERLKREIIEWEKIFPTHITDKVTADRTSANRREKTDRKNLGKRLEQKFYQKTISKQPTNVWKGVQHHYYEQGKHVKTSMRYHYNLIRRAKIRSDKDREQRELSNNAGVCVNWKTIFIVQ